jgi:hypothetical protein
LSRPVLPCEYRSSTGNLSASHWIRTGIKPVPGPELPVGLAKPSPSSAQLFPPAHGLPPAKPLPSPRGPPPSSRASPPAPRPARPTLWPNCSCSLPALRSIPRGSSSVDPRQLCRTHPRGCVHTPARKLLLRSLPAPCSGHGQWYAPTYFTNPTRFG